MPTPEQMIINILFEKAQELHNKPRSIVPFTNIPESDALLNNIEQYPHFFVLGCIMDRQIPAEKAWNIPVIISKECGGIEFQKFLSLDQTLLQSIFSEKKLHRFNDQMADHFYKAIQRIHTEYHDNAANIWLMDQPDCKEVIDRFAQFSGIGQKISTMATNILVREFKVPLKNVHEIDISVDSQVVKVFKRIGLVSANASIQDVVEASRKVYPKYPGIADSIIWELGRELCKTDLSGCPNCYLNEYCPKNQITIPLTNIEGKTHQPRGKSARITDRESRSSMIPGGKFRSRFEEILRVFREKYSSDFSIRLTSSRTNAIVKGPMLPPGVQYEFDDWNDKVSIEIILNREMVPHLVPILTKLSTQHIQELPSPHLITQGIFLRLQLFFDETASPSLIADSMNALITQTYHEMKGV